MAAEKKKVYGNMRIMAIEGKDIFRTEAITALKNGKLNADRFGGIIDESLDTDKLCEVYKAHEAEIEDIPTLRIRNIAEPSSAYHLILP